MRGTPLITEPSIHRLHVVTDEHGSRVVAAAAFSAGECILTLSGRVVKTPSRYSLQIGEQEHLAPSDDEDPRTAVWPFLNHSCAPNCAVAGRRLVTLREIAPGESVCFDYNSTEAEIAEPFTCTCGACDGRRIRGFFHLPPAEQHALLPILAPYLTNPRRIT